MSNASVICFLYRRTQYLGHISALTICTYSIRLPGIGEDYEESSRRTSRQPHPTSPFQGTSQTAFKWPNS